jgi:TatD DNase family protein
MKNEEHPYIDIHTHHTATSGSGDITVLSMYETFSKASSGTTCSMGLHPWYLNEVDMQMSELTACAMLPDVVAIGECGLDRICDTPWALQMEAFKLQIALASQLRKPLIIHCVRAYEELLQTLREYPTDEPVIIHGFNKKEQVAELLLCAGYYLSFGAAILNHTNQAAKVLSTIPADRFFLETDDAEQPIADIYAAAAAIRGTNTEAIILQQQQNYTKVFNR